jgi:hypothetical protein
MCILGRRWQRCKIRVGWQRKWLGRSNNTNVTGCLACFGGRQIPSPTNCQIPPLPHILERSLLTLPIPLPDAPHCASAHPSLWLWSPSRHPHPPGQSRWCAPSQQASSTGSKRSAAQRRPSAHHTHQRPPFHRDTTSPSSRRHHLPIASRVVDYYHL